MPAEEPNLDDPRWMLARRVTQLVLRRRSAEVLAVGVHGSLAHGSDTDAGDVDLVVVTYRPGTGPKPVARRVDGVPIDVTVVGCDDYLASARTLTASWPLTADRYVTTRPLHDPRGWLPTLRDAHLGRLAEARPAEFTSLARRAWCRAAAAHARAVRLAEWYDTDAALMLLGKARLGTALVVGLLTRTYFRNDADAVKRTGMAGADMTQLATTLKEQAEDLAERGHPVDGPLSSLFD